MLLELVSEKVRGSVSVFPQAWQYITRPWRTGQNIKLGDKQDLKSRIAFGTKIAAIVTTFQILVYEAVGLNVIGRGWDGVWALLAPALAILWPLLQYIPLRLFRLTNIPASHFLQPQLTASAVSLITVPLQMLPNIWFMIANGNEIPEHIKPITKNICTDKIESVYCLGGVMSTYPFYNSMTLVLSLCALMIGLIVNWRITKASTGIAYWRLLIAFIALFIVVMSAIFVHSSL